MKKLLILTYHRVGQDEDFISRGMGGTGVPVEEFAAQMEYLTKRSRIVSLGEAVRRAAAGTAEKESWTAVTFDDGYRDNYTRAWPVLKRLGIPATIFLVAGHAGSDRLMWQHKLYYLKDVREEAWVAAFGKSAELACWDAESRDALLDRMGREAGLDAEKEKELARSLYLQWPEILEMHKAGVEFGSHSISHPRLSGLPPEALRKEIAGSKEMLQEKLDSAVDCFCYPYGDQMSVNEEVVEQVRKAGYQAACTTAWGVNTRTGVWDPLRLRRKAVSYSRPLDMWLEFSGAKDWMRRWAGVSLAALLLAGCSASLPDEADKKIKELRIELQADPQDLEDHYQLGMLLHQKGEHAEAVEHFAQGSRDSRFGVSAQFEIAMIEYERGHYDAALAMLEKIKQDQKGFPFAEIYYHIGRVHLREGRTQAAVDNLQKSIDLGFDQKEVYYLLGDTYFRGENYYKAIPFLRKYADRDPDLPVVRLYLAKALDETGKKEEAKKEFQIVKKNAPWLKQANLVVWENFRFRDGSQWVVRGVLKNMSVIKLSDVQARASLLNAKEKVRQEQSVLVSPQNLYPSQEGSFEFRFPYDAAVKDHQIKGSGRIPQDSQGEEIEWLDKVS